ncbi:MAG: uracil-DNA glycosylase [Gammaproteobacteria bacterium]|jgi:DNA polymerase
MNTDLHSEYLKVMGIQHWVARHVGGAEAPAPGVDEAVVPEWQLLKERVSTCTRCVLHESRNRTVFGTGNRTADWLVIGEAPGAEEDRQGEPFVGRAGQLLTEMLLAIGFRRADVYITNILKCRPPNNRNPLPDEVACCNDYLQQQIVLVDPVLILAVGGVAAHNLLQTDAPVGKLRGRMHRYGEQGIPLFVTYHPSYLLRSPLEKRKVWDDLQLARRVYRERLGG